MEVKWEEKYSAGNKSLDEDHKKFFNIFNRWADSLLTDSDENTITNTLDELINFARTHFRKKKA